MPRVDTGCTSRYDAIVVRILVRDGSSRTAPKNRCVPGQGLKDTGKPPQGG